jgi:transposase
VFPGRSAAQESGRAAEAVVEKPHAKIGQVLVERDFLAEAPAR